MDDHVVLLDWRVIIQVHGTGSEMGSTFRCAGDKVLQLVEANLITKSIFFLALCFSCNNGAQHETRGVTYYRRFVGKGGGE